MPPKCKSCEKLRGQVAGKNEGIESLKKKVSDYKEKLQPLVKENVLLKAELESLSGVEITTSVDLTPYFHKIDRIAALFNTDDEPTFQLEINNFRTMLQHVRRENDTTAK